MTATIIDSDVIIDLLEPGSDWVEWSRKAIARSRIAGRIVFNVVIAAEVAHEFKSVDRFDAVFATKLWTFEHIPIDAARIAGWAHRDYRLRGGKRSQTLPDFLIGAHAVVGGYSLVTRDATRYRTYFPSLDIIAPDTHS